MNKPFAASLVAAVLALPIVSARLAVAAEPATAPTTAPTADEGSADAMYAAIFAEQMPPFDRSRTDDPAYRAELAEKQKAVADKMRARMRAFVVAHPDDPRSPRLAVTYVASSGGASVAAPGQVDNSGLQAAADEMLALPIDEQAKSAIRAMPLQRMLQAKTFDAAAATKAVDEFVAKYPSDSGAARVNFMLAEKLQKGGDDSRMRKLAESPDTESGRMASAALKKIDGVGKPFTLSFTDAVSGAPVDVQSSLKGKVVVVDFWATWCGPCVAEMPNMKKLYAEYKDKGVEFIGVSLDEPGEGLSKLKAFVAKNEIAWPQYYQGNGWNSEFSKSWGINAIPCVFVVGKDGNLLTTEGRGEETLRKIFDEQLAK